MGRGLFSAQMAWFHFCLLLSTYTEARAFEGSLGAAGYMLGIPQKV